MSVAFNKLYRKAKRDIIKLEKKVKIKQKKKKTYLPNAFYQHYLQHFLLRGRKGRE